VDVVEREDVEETVGGGVGPCFEEGAGLGCEGGLREEDAFLLFVVAKKWLVSFP
jgi:hypothetical protein